MRNRFFGLLMLIMVLLATSCSRNGMLYRSAQKYYTRGNFDAAVTDASQSLRLRPDKAKTQQLLVQAWNQSVKYHEERVSQLEQSNDPDKWMQILAEYTAMQELSRNLQSLPPLVDPNTGYRVMLIFPDISDKINASKENAAEAHYQAGIRYSKMADTRDIQKQAALEFSAAQKLSPGYKDASLKYEQSRSLAIKRLAIVPFEDISSSKNRYGAISELLTDFIISRIMELGKENEFTEIIDRSQMDTVLKEQQLSASGLLSESSGVQLGQILGAHEILTGKILQVSVTPSRTAWVNQTAKAKAVVGKEEYLDENGKTKIRDIYGEVSCLYRKYSKTTSVAVSGSFSIVEVETGKIKLQESIEIKNPWSDTWCRKLEGDERALSQSVRNQMNKVEPYPPEDSEMVVTALRELGGSVVSKAGAYLWR